MSRGKPVTYPQNGTARYTLWATVGGLALSVLIAAVVSFLWLTNLNARVAAVEGVASANKSRLDDTAKSNDRTSERIQEMQVALSRLQTSMTEVETQFCGTGNTINLMHAWDMRIQSLLWQKVFTVTLPTDNAFYPVLCRADGAGATPQ